MKLNIKIEASLKFRADSNRIIGHRKILCSKFFDLINVGHGLVIS